jgi:Plasmid pRiA4b ORF-3-like protein
VGIGRRRLLVLSETSVAQLHEYIQIAFDWSGEHLHRFRIHGKDYGIGYSGGIGFDDNPHHVPLSRFRLHPRESFRYEYDFTSNWRVDIRLEESLPLYPHSAVCRFAAATGESHRGKSTPERSLIWSSWVGTATLSPSKNSPQWPKGFVVGRILEGIAKPSATLRSCAKPPTGWPPIRSFNRGVLIAARLPENCRPRSRAKAQCQ